MSPNIVLSLLNITKDYPGVKALDNVSIEFRRGEVHALVGENGAGKSTFIKILAGAVKPNDGTINIGTETFYEMHPVLAKKHGIEVIYQEFNLVPSLSVAENIFLGSPLRHGPLVDMNAMVKRSRELLKELNIDLDPRGLVRNLSAAYMQIVEIVKAVSREVEILVMDEPTASLSVSEVELLFGIVRTLQRRGVTIIYISHRLEEIFAISDRVTVLMDGRYIATRDTAATTRDELIKLMVGRDLGATYPEHRTKPGKEILRVDHLSGHGVHDISFSVHENEIFGISGLVGSGRTELVRQIYGADRPEKGRILLDGQAISIHSPRDAIAHGIGLIPEDRKSQGIFLRMGITWNISSAIIRRLSRFLTVNRKKEKTLAEGYRDRLAIRTSSMGKLVQFLSGGNQQKVVLAKTLATESRLLIFDEPTRGIDVGAKQEIYRLMTELADSGIGIIMISSEMEELIGMGDRMMILCEGRKMGELPKAEFNHDTILDMASGNR